MGAMVFARPQRSHTTSGRPGLQEESGSMSRLPRPDGNWIPTIHRWGPTATPLDLRSPSKAQAIPGVPAVEVGTTEEASASAQ